MSRLVPSCTNCGEQLAGRWCARCGQKQIEDTDRRFGHLVGQFAHELFHADGKLPRSLAALLFRPGGLSRAYLDGQRVRHISPIGLFLIINLVYFLAPPVTDFNLSIQDQMYLQPYSALVQPLVEQRLEDRGMALDDYAPEYANRADKLAKTLIIVHLPLLALVLLLLHPRKRLYYAEHFVVTTHLFSFLLVLMMVGYALFFAGMGIGNQLFSADLSGLFSTLWRYLPLIAIVYWLISIRRVYGDGWLRSSLTLAGWMIGVIVVHMLVYRPAQFALAFMLS